MGGALCSLVFWAAAVVLGSSLFMTSIALHQPAFGQGYPRDQYGNVATPVVGVFQGADTTTAVATLPAAVGKTTYVCAINVNGLGATSQAVINIAVASVVGGITMNFQYVMPAGNSNQSTPMQGSFNPCIPATAPNTVITVTVTGAAGNTSTNINVSGYQL